MTGFRVSRCSTSRLAPETVAACGVQEGPDRTSFVTERQVCVPLTKSRSAVVLPLRSRRTRVLPIVVAAVSEHGDAAATEQPELHAWTSRVLHRRRRRRRHGREHLVVFCER